MSERTLSVLDGSTFVVGDRLGDLCEDSGREHGFYCADTRFLSRFVLRVGDAPLDLLGLDQSAHYEAQFFLTPLVGPHDQAPCSVMRRRLIDQVWLEEVTVINHLHEPLELRVVLELATDFADLFEVKDDAVAPRDVTFEHDDRSLTLGYSRGDFQRSVTVAADTLGAGTPAASTPHAATPPRSTPGTSAPGAPGAPGAAGAAGAAGAGTPAVITRAGFDYALELGAGELWSTTFTVTPFAAQPGTRFTERRARGNLGDLAARKAAELDQWLAGAPTLESEHGALLRTYRASLTDLGALRLKPDLSNTDTLPAAGLPWFMALFGRDSLITSYQALPYLPELAATTLRVLAGAQADGRDDFHEEEPGKILHEWRFGELTALGERPHSPYYGSADATPLFLILLDEYHRWTGDEALVRELEPNARAALAWIEQSGDADGDGYVEYACRNPATGLVNQCWKDSWDAIQFANGMLARGPIATCEIQGYVYDARRRAARLARDVWGDEVLAMRLEHQAAELRAALHHDFWIPERGCHALALDGHKQRVDSLTSNIGHLLWSGVLDDDQAAATADWLLDGQLRSDWGVRTLGTHEAGYNPLGYHTGTVWPHENSLIVAGLARYGHHHAAGTIACSILRAAPHFEHRLPEVFAGYPSATSSVPVAFPTASRPQAWAAGTPLLLLTTLLDLQPNSPLAEATLPDGIGRVALHSPSGRPAAKPPLSVVPG